MDKAKFTPGPWELEETEEGHVIRMGKAIENTGMFPSHMEIEYNHGCLLDGEEGDVFSEAEIEQALEARANALLISAAPEMYEARLPKSLCLCRWAEMHGPKKRRI